MTFYVNDDDRLWREPKPRGWFRFPGPFRYVLLLILLVGCVIGGWYLFSSFRQTPNKAELPLLRADNMPFKMKAEDKGVPGVTHQDKLVYGRIRNDQQAPPVEHILPDPEPPLAQLKEPPAVIQMVEEYTPEDVKLETVAEEVSDSPSDPTPALTPAIGSIEALIDEVLPVAIPSPAKKGKVLIQLGSLKSHDLAESEWARLSKKHKDALRKFEPMIQKVDLGETQGIYHRLRTGPFETIEKAQAMCAVLKERGVDCLVIK